MFCGNCGREIKEGMRFCVYCGTEAKSVKVKRFPIWIIVVVLLIIVILVLILGGAAKKMQRRSEMNSQMKIAQRYMEDLEYEQAVATYKAVLEIDPNNASALKGLENAYRSWAESVDDPEKRTEIYREAEAFFEKGANAGNVSGNHDMYLELARIMGDHAEGNTDILQNVDVELVEEILPSVWTVQITVVGANEGVTLSNAVVTVENDKDLSQNMTDDAGRITLKLPVREDPYRINFSKDGFNGRSLDVFGDTTYIIALAPQASAGDACVLLEWDGEQDLDLCAFNATVKEYVNISHPVGEGGDFLYADRDAEDGYELLYIRDINAENVKSIYVLDSEAVRQDQSSGMEADGVSLYVYTSEGLRWSGKANSAHNEPVWRPMYFYQGQVYEEEEYLPADMAAFENKTEADKPVVETTTKELRFSDIPSCFRYWTYTMSSIWTEINIEKDGTFQGEYYSYVSMETGPGYENGTKEGNHFEGKFSNPVQVDEYTYRIRIEYINTERDSDRIINGTREITTSPEGISNTSDLYLYLPGTPISHMQSDMQFWVDGVGNVDRSGDLSGDVNVLPDGNYGLYQPGNWCGFIGVK